MGDRAFQVLLVEDDAGDAIIVERTLRRCRQQFVIRHVECLEDAVATLADGGFDIVLLDLSLPDSFGLPALNKIQARSQDVPVVVLTGLSDDDLAMQSLEQGAQDYLVKGNTTSDLLERTLRYAIQRQRIQVENRSLLKRLEELAWQDALTGVMNRHSFNEHLEREWLRAQRHGLPLACAVVDIDFFKRINDVFGHAVGDQTLKQVAATLTQNSRPSDSVGRLGGEEFCVLLPETSEEAATAWGERVRKEISRLPLPAQRDVLHVTVSIGVASRRNDSLQPQDLVGEADEAMFLAKQLGRDQVISFSRLRMLDRCDPTQIWYGATVGDLMSQLEMSLTPCRPIRDAIECLHSGHADSISVLDGEGCLVGVIGSGDIVAAALTSGHLEGTVGEYMQTQLVTRSPEAPAWEVCEFLCRTALSQVHVVEGTRPLGVIRRGNFVRWIHESMNERESGRVESFGQGHALAARRFRLRRLVRK